MQLNIECSDKSGDVTIGLVDRGNIRCPFLVATMEKHFNQMERAEHIRKCVNNWNELLRVVEKCEQALIGQNEDEMEQVMCLCSSTLAKFSGE